MIRSFCTKIHNNEDKFAYGVEFLNEKHELLPLLEYLHNIPSYCCKNVWKTYTQKYLTIIYNEASYMNKKMNT